MFTHLHCHTEFSLLDGLAKIPALMERARALGQEALAITDHGNLYGAIDFHKAAMQAGLHPILGMEAYVARGDHREHAATNRESSHLTLLAENDRGWRNLITLATKAHLDGFYYRPRVDRALLEQHREGLIVLSGCPSGLLHQALQEDRWDDARSIAAWFHERFEDRYFLEVQNHDDPHFTPTIPKLVELGRETGIPLVATQDSHYTNPGDAETHEVLLCIGTNTTIDQPDRFRLDGNDFYLTSEAEMRGRFPDLPEAIANTTRIAERCDVTLEFGRLLLPDPDLPAGVDADSHLATLARAGLQQRYGHPTPPVIDRLDYELSVVAETGFAEYFLIVSDFAQFARDRRIAMGVRGSAAGSIILYCLGVTDIDPIPHDLVFERFLNVERHEMPDIDMDFADNRRDEVIRYVADKYGHDRVAQIITFGTLGAKAALRDTGRALGMTFAETDRVARLVPTQLNITLEQALEKSGELRGLTESEPQVARLVETARKLEGVARHAGTHAAAVVIARDPLVENVPLQRPVHGDDDAIPMTQWAMNPCADVGLLKMDFLGLSNLTILQSCIDLVRETTGQEVDYLHLPDRDAQTFAMLGRGETFGVFQLESAGMRRVVKKLKPTELADLAALVALYRPGPMEHIRRYIAGKHGQERVRYPHPDLAEILDETYGVIVYQDQVLHIARKFAGYTLGQADVMRKAMGKKIAGIMREERGNFIAGARRNGYGDQDASSIFDLIEPFAGYAFNKAHAVCYGSIAYQTAYLKAHYPACYMTAVLRSAAGQQDRVGVAVAECVRLGIPVLPPDINRSHETFTTKGAQRTPAEETVGAQPHAPQDTEGAQPHAPQDTNPRPGIRFGLASVKNVGSGAVAALLAEREEHGPFRALEDLCKRADLRALNKRALESLIKAGALDTLAQRGPALAGIDRILRLAQHELALRDSGQTTMFDLFGDEVETPRPELLLADADVTRAELLQWEKELLGAYLSAHPFQRAAAGLAPHVTAQAAEITEEMDGQEIIVAGMVNLVRPLTTRKGDPFCAAELEDLSGAVEVTVWPDLFASTRDLWADGTILLIHARVRTRGGRLTVAAEHVTPYVGGPDGSGRPQEDPARWRVAPAGGPRARNRTPRKTPSAPSVRAGGNGANGGDRPPPTQGAPPSAAPLLRIRLRETDDTAADQRRLHEVMRLVRATPGDRPALLVVAGVAEAATLRLPNCRPSAALIAALSAALGEFGAAEIIAQPAPVTGA